MCFWLPWVNHKRVERAVKAGVRIAAGSDEYYQAPGMTRGEAAKLMFRAYANSGMPPLEIIRAATINAAYSLGRHTRVGSLEVNKQADLAVFDVADYREIPYYFGMSLCWMTMKAGVVIYAAD